VERVFRRQAGERKRAAQVAAERWVQARKPCERPVLLAYAPFSGLAASGAVAALVEREFAAHNICVLARATEGDRVRQLPVRVKTKVPLGVALGAPLGVMAWALWCTWATGASLYGLMTAGLAQLFETAAAGGFLGSVFGLVAGLGYWHTAVDVPRVGVDSARLVVGVDLGAQGQLAAAHGALMAAGAERVYVHTKRAIIDDFDAAFTNAKLIHDEAEPHATSMPSADQPNSGVR